MKILLVNNNYYKKGGTETVYLNTIELLEKKNHTVVTFSQQNSQNETSTFSKYFTDVNSFYHNHFYSFESKKKINELIENEKPQIAHIHNIIGGITYSVLAVLKNRKIPIVASIHDFRILCPVYIFINGRNEICEKCKTGKYYNCIMNNCSPEGLKRSILLSAESYLRDYIVPYNKIISKFIFVSKFAQNKFLEFNPNLKEKSYHIYNFTDKFELHSKRGNYFLYFGRLSREKGLLTLLKAFEKLGNLKLKIAGDGSLLEQIEAIKTPNIELLGYKFGEELNKIIRQSSFVIVPSECYETLSMTTVESFSMGKPVIASELGALTELVQNSNRGFLFSPGDINSLVSKVSQASNLTDSQYTAMSENAYNFAKSNFSYETHYNKLIDIYSQSVKSN